jgi:hypothetical protein
MLRSWARDRSSEARQALSFAAVGFFFWGLASLKDSQSLRRNQICARRLRGCERCSPMKEGTSGPAGFASGPFSLGSWDFGRRSRLTFVAAPIVRAARHPAPEAPKRNQRLRFEQAIFPEMAVAAAWEATVLSQCREPDLTSAR